MPKYLYIEEKAAQNPESRRIRQSLPNCKTCNIQDHRKLDVESVPLQGYNTKIKHQVLVLAHHPGPFIRPFPGAALNDNPREFFIAHANGCPFDCQYCFLQGYFDHGAPVLFINQNDLYQEMTDHLAQHTDHQSAIYHAGELSDALALEAWSKFAARTIPLFYSYPRASLELRTKAIDAEHLLPDNPPENVITSWTLTPTEAWRRYEKGTPSPIQRLKSAQACQKKGYRIGIRLDPAFIFPDWEKGYEQLVQQIFEYLLPAGIESFVISGFRHPPALAGKIRARFPSSPLLLSEFVACRDGKHRYFRPLRVQLYRKIIQEIRKHEQTARITLCMESKQVQWDSFGRNK